MAKKITSAVRCLRFIRNQDPQVCCDRPMDVTFLNCGDKRDAELAELNEREFAEYMATHSPLPPIWFCRKCDEERDIEGLEWPPIESEQMDKPRKKKTAKTSQKHRAFKMLESLEWTVGDVEKWIPQAKRRIDLFGFADLLAVKDDATLAVQVTSGEGGNVGAHVTKMLAEPRLAACLRAGWLVELWGVRKAATRDGETVKVRSFELSDDGSKVIVYEGSEVLVPVERSV